MDFKINKEYPEIKVERKNKYYAQLLLDDYASDASEDTSIHQYIYQSFDLFDKYPDIAKPLARIAMVEMKHLELLGKTIKALGVEPKFIYVDAKKRYYTYWNSSSVDYAVKLHDMLVSDIELEKKAIRSYQKHIDMIDDKYIKVLLKRIIEDELIHIRCFNKLIAMINK